MNYPGLQNMYAEMVKFDKVLSCAQARADAGKCYDRMESSFEQFQKHLKDAILEKERTSIRNRRMTMTTTNDN